MPTEKHRINITVEDWMWDAIEDYRYRNRLASKSQAVVQMVEQVLNANSEETVDKHET